MLFRSFIRLAPDDANVPLVRRELQKLLARPTHELATLSAARRTAIAYTRQVDQLLSNSAATRKDLGKLIANFDSGQETVLDAQQQIQSIINQRQSLENAIATVITPAAFVQADNLLRDSVAAALSDDTAIQTWIDAVAQGGKASAAGQWSDHLQATARATKAKQAFVSAYNRVRARYGLGPFAIGSSY